jgi:hypothetical protein
MDLKFKDRGVKKWTSFMLPEHIEMLQQYSDHEYYKTSKPILDPYQIQEIEEKIHYAMEFHYPVIFKVWYDGFTEEVSGYIHYLDPILKEIRVKDHDGYVEHVKFEDIIEMEVEDT